MKRTLALALMLSSGLWLGATSASACGAGYVIWKCGNPPLNWYGTCSIQADGSCDAPHPAGWSCTTTQSCDDKPADRAVFLRALLDQLNEFIVENHREQR